MHKGKKRTNAETITSIGYVHEAFRCTCASSGPRAKLQSEGMTKFMLAIGPIIKCPRPC